MRSQVYTPQPPCPQETGALDDRFPEVWGFTPLPPRLPLHLIHPLPTILNFASEEIMYLSSRPSPINPPETKRQEQAGKPSLSRKHLLCPVSALHGATRIRLSGEPGVQPPGAIFTPRPRRGHC